MSTAETRPGAWSGPVFKSLVLLALDRMLSAYRTDVAGTPGAEPHWLPQSVTIVTATPLNISHGEIRARIKYAGLTNPHPSIAVTVDPGVTDPGFRIVIQPRLSSPDDPTDGCHTIVADLDDGWDDDETYDDATGDTEPYGATSTYRGGAGGTRPYDGSQFNGGGGTRRYEGPEGAAPQPDRAVLTLCYGLWRWAFPIIASQTWIPLGRGLGSELRSSVRVPDFVNSVPRGALLRLRYQDGVTHLRRVAERVEYLVSVDGRRLPPGHAVQAGAAGSIDYSLGAGASTTLRYELIRKDVHDGV